MNAQQLAAEWKAKTGKTLEFDNILEILRNMKPDDSVPDEICVGLLRIMQSVPRDVVERAKAVVGASNDSDVKFSGASAEYLLKIAEVLYNS